MSENLIRVPTKTLIGRALDYAVARGAGCRVEHNYPYAEDYIFYGWWQCGPAYWQPLNSYSTVWSLGGPLVAREKVSLEIKHDGWWVASMKFNHLDEAEFMQCADSPLVAAMRCFVASKFGGEVEVPERLLKP